MDRNQQNPQEGLLFVPREQKNNPPPVKKGRGRLKKSFAVWLREGFSPFAPRAEDPNVVYIKGVVDGPLLAAAVLLLAAGTVMIFSASYAFALYTYGESAYFLGKQILYLFIGIAAAAVAFFIPFRLYERLGPLYYGIVAAGLILVLFIGPTGGGAQRWIEVPVVGLTIQPSEFMKNAIVFLLARYYVRFSKKVREPKDRFETFMYGVAFPLIPVAFVLILIVLEKHVSGLVIVALISWAVMVCGGTKFRWLAAVALIGVAGGIVVILLFSHSSARVDSWLNIDAYYDSGEQAKRDLVWQSYHGRNAVGSGGLFGLGFGESRLKHLFVSMPQNDFIFSILAEETGLIGCLGVIGLFAFFVWRGFSVARRIPDPFMKMTVIGLTFKVGLQAALNIAVVTALIPNTGVALPFFSYGGSALLAQMIEVGVLLSLSRYAVRPREERKAAQKSPA